MSRKNEPWYWEARQGWYVNINGKRRKLSKDKPEAFEEFYRLKAANPSLEAECVVIVMDEMVEWTRKNRAAGTFRFYHEHAQQFTDWLKGIKSVDIPCSDLSVDLFEQYLEECSPGRRNGAVQMIKRVYNWANRRGRITVNPIAALEKPPAGKRNNYITLGIYKKMLKHTDQGLGELIEFMWETGCRPQEAWRATSEHIECQYKRVALPVELTKRKKTDRHIYCTERAWEIVESRADAENFLFTTTTATQWNKDNIGKRMDSLRNHLGKRYALYDIRHTWITNKVKSGMDIHMIAKLAGTSIAMIERVYDKSDDDAQFMLDALRNSKKAG